MYHLTAQRGAPRDGLVDVLLKDQPSILVRELVLDSATNLRQGMRQVNDASALGVLGSYVLYWNGWFRVDISHPYEWGYLP